MIGERWLRPPRRVLTSFLAVVVACVGALAWLGYRFLEQDRALESQRIQEQLEVAADRAAALLERQLAELQRILDDAPSAAKLPDGTILIVARAQDLEVYGSRRLLFYPQLRPLRQVSSEALRRAELVEFQKNDPLTASTMYREAARSREPALRGAALVRLGRTLRKAGRIQEALEAYGELAALGSAPVSGFPAELLAREARCSALEASGQDDALRGEAATFLRDLESGRWRITRSAYEFRVDEARRWIGGGATSQPSFEALALSNVVEGLVGEWMARPEASSGRRTYVTDSQPVLASWKATEDRLTATVAGPEYLTSLWTEAVGDRKISLALTDSEGQAVFGKLPEPPARSVVRTAAVTKLPWTLHVAGTDLVDAASGIAGRQRLLLAGLFILTVLLVLSSYSIVRAMTKELAVARQQSDFVASVSHEFRSPLTSLRQLSSMLVQGRLASNEQRQRSYEFLGDETGRLERLIEGLLDFGLMEAGETHYRFEEVDAGELVGDIVTAFQRTVTAKGYQVELSLPSAGHRVRADRDALGRAIWNLLDNAVKYSPAHHTVWVDVTPRGSRLGITVRDQGMGIPRAEQRAIFGKFVRGASSREAGVKGTGLGLAMVKHIVVAHGGEIRLESVEGKGSRFTILVPLGNTA
jgi:signal transduction histidine kinase/tetratricopeptide (TPR) repeat protein